MDAQVIVFRHFYSQSTGKEYGIYGITIDGVDIVVMQRGDDYRTFYRDETGDNKLIDDAVKELLQKLSFPQKQDAEIVM